MSTRSNILLKDEYGDDLWFYRHSDGYPEGAMPLIATFVHWVNSGRLRANAIQSGGWLIALGMKERQQQNFLKRSDVLRPDSDAIGTSVDGWKVGAIEPTTCEHDDIEYRYTINLETSKERGLRDANGTASVLCEEISIVERRSQDHPAQKSYTPVDVSEWTG